MAASYRSDKAYEGEEKIIIAMDIGTTQSAVSFSHLCTDDYPVVRLVTKWPGQENSTGDAKIPTLVAYQNGSPHFFGVEAAGYIGDDDYEMAQWFKLHLHPSSMKESDLPPPFGYSAEAMPQIEIPALPTGVDLYRVYTDYMKYLYEHTREFFIGSTPNGDNIWNRLQSNIMFIFCHPNGWDVSQQGFLTACAVQAGMIKTAEASTRVSFVSEGEASVHYALAYTPSNSWLQPGGNFLVVDAGGSTIDSNFYECSSIAPLKLKEVHRSECIQIGGVFVDRAARKLLEKKLATSAKFNSEEIISEMTGIFEQKTKRLFGGSLPSNVIHFGRNSDNDREHGILKGKLTLSNEEIASTFEESIRRTVQNCIKILGNQTTRHLLLVGGFGESPYLRTKITEEFRPLGTEVIVVDQPSKKAAAEGAIIWNLKRAVALRVCRFTLGIRMDTVYNHDLQEHRDRMHQTYIWGDGTQRLHTFGEWIGKGTPVEDGWEVTKYYREVWKEYPGQLGDYSEDVYCWEGSGSTTKWVNDMQGNLLQGLRKVCTLKVPLADIQYALEKGESWLGAYWFLRFEIVLRLGGTDFKAWMQWTENGVTRQGPIIIITPTKFKA
ncbi:hypothetical protein CPB86DRAFT_877647 [Serendipita vermifera]|nr:hypothetical protein CPB86DRAFT_877647 [Serendipita vermifera]